MPGVKMRVCVLLLQLCLAVAGMQAVASFHNQPNIDLLEDQHSSQVSVQSLTGALSKTSATPDLHGTHTVTVPNTARRLMDGQQHNTDMPHPPDSTISLSQPSNTSPPPTLKSYLLLVLALRMSDTGAAQSLVADSAKSRQLAEGVQQLLTRHLGLGPGKVYSAPLTSSQDQVISVTLIDSTSGTTTTTRRSLAEQDEVLALSTASTTRQQLVEHTHRKLMRLIGNHPMTSSVSQEPTAVGPQHWFQSSRRRWLQSSPAQSCPTVDTSQLRASAQFAGYLQDMLCNTDNVVVLSPELAGFTLQSAGASATVITLLVAGSPEVVAYLLASGSSMVADLTRQATTLQSMRNEQGSVKTSGFGAAPVIGAVIGSAAAVAVIAIAMIVIRRRQLKQRRKKMISASILVPTPKIPELGLHPEFDAPAKTNTPDDDDDMSSGIYPPSQDLAGFAFASMRNSRDSKRMSFANAESSAAAYSASDVKPRLSLSSSPDRLRTAFSTPTPGVFGTSDRRVSFAKEDSVVTYTPTGKPRKSMSSLTDRPRNTTTSAPNHRPRKSMGSLDDHPEQSMGSVPDRPRKSMGSMPTTTQRSPEKRVSFAGDGGVANSSYPSSAPRQHRSPWDSAQGYADRRVIATERTTWQEIRKGGIPVPQMQAISSYIYDRLEGNVNVSLSPHPSANGAPFISPRQSTSGATPGPLISPRQSVDGLAKNLLSSVEQFATAIISPRGSVDQRGIGSLRSTA